MGYEDETVEGCLRSDPDREIVASSLQVSIEGKSPSCWGHFRFKAAKGTVSASKPYLLNTSDRRILDLYAQTVEPTTEDEETVQVDGEITDVTTLATGRLTRGREKLSDSVNGTIRGGAGSRRASFNFTIGKIRQGDELTWATDDHKVYTLKVARPIETVGTDAGPMDEIICQVTQVVPPDDV